MKKVLSFLKVPNFFAHGLVYSLYFSHFNPQIKERVKWKKNILTNPWSESSFRKMLNLISEEVLALSQTWNGGIGGTPFG
jgi:hypothetical protein